MPNYATANNMFTTIRCKMHVTNRLGQKTEEAKRCSFFNILEQSSSAIGGNNWSAIRMRSVLGVENFPRHDNFRDTNDVDFTKEFAESLADRCKSRLTSEMSNATLSKRWHDENDDFHFLTKLISRRTLNLTFPNAFPSNRVPICR